MVTTKYSHLTRFNIQYIKLLYTMRPYPTTHFAPRRENEEGVWYHMHRKVGIHRAKYKAWR